MIKGITAATAAGVLAVALLGSPAWADSDARVYTDGTLAGQVWYHGGGSASKTSARTPAPAG